MLTSIKNAFSELEHVVWPTETESKKYMLYTVGIIIILSLFLAIIGYFLSGSLSGVRGQFSEYHTPITSPSVSGEDLATEADLQNLIKEVQPTVTSEEAPIVPTTASGAQ